MKWYDPVSAASEWESLSPISTSLSEDKSASRTEIERDGDHITMRLMYRTTISTLALPKSASWPSDLIPPHAAPWHFAPDILSFSRFMLATPDYMNAELRSDLMQLEREIGTLRKLGTSANDLGIVFIEAAKRKVLEQIEKVATLRTPLVQESSETAWFELEALQDRAGAIARRKEREAERAGASSTSAEEIDDYVPPESVLSNNHSAYPMPARSARISAPVHPTPSHASRSNRTRRNVNPPAPNDTSYLFYQASSGQNVYLHPLDIKILKSHFEIYDAFPLSIRVKVEGTEEGSMNDDLRKRCRYLSHLPQACDLTFIEADLASVIPQQALAPYNQALRKRQAKRKDRIKRDDKARLKSEQAASQRERSSLAVGVGFPQAPVEELSFPALEETSNGEQLIREDQLPSSLAVPDLKTGESHSTSENKTIWGTRLIPAATPSLHAAAQTEEDDPVDLAVESAWNDFDAMQIRGGRRPGRKKKIVLNLSGGAVSLRR